MHHIKLPRETCNVYQLLTQDMTPLRFVIESHREFPDTFVKRVRAEFIVAKILTPLRSIK